MGRKTGSKRRKSWSNKRNLSSKANSIAKSSRNARFARRNARVKSKAGLHPTKYGSLKLNWSTRDIAKRLTNHKVAKALGLHSLAGKIPKGWKTNISLKTGIKSKIGEPNYRTTSANHPGGGLTQADIDAYDFYARYNPDGVTIADKKKVYANQLAEGFSLQQAMEMNPSETMSFYALIDDSDSTATDTTNTTTQSTNNNNPMAFNFEQYGVLDPNRFGAGIAGVSHNADLIYQNIIGRNMDPAGRAYWTSQIMEKGEQGYKDMVNSLLASTEYADRAEYIAANPDATGQDLKRLASAYVSPFHTYAGGAAAGWTPADDVTEAVANSVTTGGKQTTDADGNVHIDLHENNQANYGDQTNKTVDDVINSNILANVNKTAADALNTTLGGPTGITGGNDTAVATNADGQWEKIHDMTAAILGSGAIDSNAAANTMHTYVPGTTVTDGSGNVIGVVEGDENNNTNTPGGGATLTTADGSTVTLQGDGTVTGGDNNTSNWWDAYSDLDALKAALGIGGQTTTNTTTDFDQFTKFITALSGIQGLFGSGGGGYGYGGYGGFNPGGVAQASTTDKMTSLLDAFKNMNSTSGSAASTSTINV